MVSFIKNRFLDILKKIKYFNYSIIVLIGSCLFVWLIVSWKTSWYYMNIYANRYLFVVYSLASVFSVVSFFYIIKLLSNKVKIAFYFTLVFACLLSFLSHFESKSNTYLFWHETDGVTLQELENDANSVILLDFDWVVVCFAPKLYNTNSYFATSIYEYKNNKYFENADTDKPYYVIMDQQYITEEELDEEYIKVAGKRAALYTNEASIVGFFESENNVDYLEYVGTDYLVKRKYKIYRVHFK